MTDVEQGGTARDRDLDVQLVFSKDQLGSTLDMRPCLALLHSKGCKLKISSKRQHVKAVGGDIAVRRADAVEALDSGSWNLTHAALNNHELLTRIEYNGDGHRQGEDSLASFYQLFRQIWKANTSSWWHPDSASAGRSSLQDEDLHDEEKIAEEVTSKEGANKISTGKDMRRAA